MIKDVVFFFKDAMLFLEALLSLLKTQQIQVGILSLIVIIQTTYKVNTLVVESEAKEDEAREEEARKLARKAAKNIALLFIMAVVFVWNLF
ncbi:hypothetical protein K8R14_02945 [bacterium]|nr:hypothetical protein [bacterium]